MAEEQGKGDGKSDAYEEAAEQTRDNNRAAAKQWLELAEACEAEADGGCHFHWLADESVYDEVKEVLESGEADGRSREGAGMMRKNRAASQDAFEGPGCKAIVKRLTGNLSDCVLLIPGKKSRREVGIYSMICIRMIFRWR